jgi:cobalt-zinc-cadmium efflux system outer membrane protein
MGIHVRCAAAVAAAVILAGCASLPRDSGTGEISELVHARAGVTPDWTNGTAVDPAAGSELTIPVEPLSAERAVALAFMQSPRIREEFARLGFARADIEEARRIANPTFGYAELDLRDGDGTQITRSFSLSLTDLLLLSARKRLASGEMDRLRDLVASELLDLARDVEVAWYECVGAAQIATMRESVARSAENSALLAQRFFDAGNISRLQLEREHAAAAQGRINAVRAAASALRARSELGGLLGLPGRAAWSTDDRLPDPTRVDLDTDSLVTTALEQRLDLSAARRTVALREDVLGVTQRWRWLGSVEVGYERESEVDGGVIRGPSLALQLPIFNQGQGAIAAADAGLVEARARLDQLALAVENDARLGVEQLKVSYDIAEQYRTALVPRREAIVARSQEQVNYMLIGIFDLIAAKQDEYDAYQGYLDAVREYWVARAELRRLVGGRLPDDGDSP